MTQGETGSTKEERRKSPYFREESFKEKEDYWHTGIRETNHNNGQETSSLE